MRRAPAYFVALLTILTIGQFTAHGSSFNAQYTRIHAIIAEPDQNAARAMELTWSPLETGGLVGREYSACTYYHLRH